MALEKENKKKMPAVQQTFPGWEDITTDGKPAYFDFDDDGYPGGYTNIKYGKHADAQKRMRGQA